MIRRLLDNFKLIILVVFILCIVLFFGIYLRNINHPSYGQSYLAQDGVMDLRNWDGEGILRLNGQWEFYPDYLYSGGSLPQEKDNILVPGSWKKTFGTPEGSGTYRLKILVPEDGVYSFKIQSVRFASKVFVNGLELSSTGELGDSLENYVPESKFSLAVGEAKSRKLDLIIPVSSYGFSSGGITRGVYFGEFNQLLSFTQRLRLLESATLVALLIMGMYFIVAFSHNVSDRFLLYYGIGYFSVAAYMAVSNEQLLSLLISYDHYTRVIILVSSIMLSSIFSLLAINDFLKDYASPLAVKIIVAMNTLTLLLMYFFSFRNYHDTQGYFQLIMVLNYSLSYGYVLIILVKAINYRDEYSNFIWIIASSYMAYWVLIAMKFLFDMDTGALPTIVMLVLFVGVSLLVNYHLRRRTYLLNVETNRLIMEDKLKDAFLQKTSEELRLPLFSVKSIVAKLSQGAKGSLNSSQQEDLVYINRELHSISSVVENLLNASRPPESSSELSIGTLDVHLLAEEILLGVRLLAGDKPVTFVNLINPDFPLIKADAKMFIQILNNLLYNALSATESGEISVAARVEGNKARIIVKDQGEGIRRQELGAIFDMFYVGEKSQGLGLGLSIVKNLVELQGGSVEVKSQEGQGSEFSFTLPIRIGLDRVEYREEVPDYDYSISATDLLVVSASDRDRKIYNSLIDHGFRVNYASSEKQVQDALTSYKIELVIVDFTSSDIPSNSLCRVLRESYSLVELPIIAIAAAGTNIDAYKYGINDYMRKPIDPQELETRVNSLLMMKHSVEEGIDKEFRYFHSQISPHFLYNTLNSIINLSYGDEEKTREALYNLSTYFRGKLDLHRDSSLVNISEELELVQAYLEIEKLRFGDKLKINLDVDEAVEALIPRLTIQPLVENAINHGVKELEQGTITVSVKGMGNMVIIKVIDDGVGMEKEKIDEIMEGRNPRLGINTTVSKIRMMKGASLKIDSELGKGTTVTIGLLGG